MRYNVNEQTTYERTLLMPFRLRQISPDDKLSHHLLLHVFKDCCPLEVVSEVLDECHGWEERERKLNMVVIVYLIIAFSLFPLNNTVEVLSELARGARFVWPDPSVHVPTKGAISTRRKQLKHGVLHRLVRRCCRPMATPATKGAFVLGLRIMAIDGTLQDVADVHETAQHFGRISSGKSASPFPQMRCVYLAECATHAIIASVKQPCSNSEQAMVWGLLPRIESGMLITMDRGFFSGVLIQEIQAKGAHVLARLQSNMLLSTPTRQQMLADGSHLTVLTSKSVPGLSKPLTLRVIPYRITGSGVPHEQEEQRLVTTWLDPEQISAQDLVNLYHERWEIELIIDEQKTHLRLSQTPLRSRTVKGCYQEMDGMLLAHYAIRHLMHQAALQGDVDPDRLSFLHAVHVVQRSLQDFAQTDPADHPALKERLLQDLRAQQVRVRTLRFVPRVVKRPLSSFRRKRWWHHPVHLKDRSFFDIFLI